MWYPAAKELDVFELPNNVTVIDNYAFQTAKNLQGVVLNPDCELIVKDYAFSGCRIREITIGDKVVSLGTIRGEGEYTIFADCMYLTNIIVSDKNEYYSSIDGILYDKGQVTLYKYPSAKIGSDLYVPNTVMYVSPMAFKANNNIRVIQFDSYVSYIGLEAFYNCNNLSVVFFKGNYAPYSISENAFTSTSTIVIGYSKDYYENGNDIIEYGWNNYNGVYNIQEMTKLPDVSTEQGNGYYAIVIVDRNGNRVAPNVDDEGKSNFIVTLEDPSGTKETVYAGSDGVAVFKDIYGIIGMGLALNFEETYKLRVSDKGGVYLSFASNGFRLDNSTRITYVTLVERPEVYGLNLDEKDINTETQLINKAEYGTHYTEIRLIDESKGYTEDNFEFVGEEDDTITISVIGYYKADLYECVSTDLCMLYQNGKPIVGCYIDKIEYEEDSAIIYFVMPVKSLIPEIPVEA